MALLILLNSVTVGSTPGPWPGTPFDSVQQAEEVQQLESAGGIFVSSSNAAVAASASTALRVKRSGGSPEKAASILLAAAVSQLQTDLTALASQVTALATIEEPTKIADFTAVPRSFVPVDPTAGAFTITLPSAVGLTVDDAVTISNVSASSNVVTVSKAGQTINGAATYSIALAWLTVTFIPVGGNWVASIPQ